jgi:hypothetical protein
MVLSCPSPVVARSSLAPFDCTRHGDVWLMDADPSIECGVPDGPNARMRPIAMLCIAWFVLGLPIAFSAFLWWNREAVGEDQRLRERGEGDTAFTNPHFQVRQGLFLFVASLCVYLFLMPRASQKHGSS